MAESPEASDLSKRVSARNRLHRASAALSHIVIAGVFGHAAWLVTSSEITTIGDTGPRQVVAVPSADTEVADRLAAPRSASHATSRRLSEAGDNAPADAVTTAARDVATETAPTAMVAMTASRSALPDLPSVSAGSGPSPIVPPVARVRPPKPEEIVVQSGFPADELPLPKHLWQRQITHEARRRATPQDVTETKPSAEQSGADDTRSSPDPVPEKIGVKLKRRPYLVVPEWSEAQINEARQACETLLKQRNITFEPTAPIKQGSCGAPAPVRVSHFGASNVALKPAATLTCPMVAAIDDWLTEVVQPAAKKTFGSAVDRLVSVSSYSCRNRYGSKSTPISEHALVNALDLSGFKLADGRSVRVLDGWGATARDRDKLERKAPLGDDTNVDTAKDKGRGKKIEVADLSDASLSKLGAGDLAKTPSKRGTTATPSADSEAKKPSAAEMRRLARAAERKQQAEQRSAFLRTVHGKACGIFGTVLGPEANDAHRDHFHFDMKKRRYKGYCQ